MSLVDLLIVLGVAAVGAVGFFFVFGAEEVSELEWKKRKAVDDLERIQEEQPEEARQRIIDLINDEGMK